MQTGVPAETAGGDIRVSVAPETADKSIAHDHTVRAPSRGGRKAVATSPDADGA